LGPKQTGIEHVVFVYPGVEERVPTVMVGMDPRQVGGVPKLVVSISLEPKVMRSSGSFGSGEIDRVKKWLILNHEVLTKFWDMRIGYSIDIIRAVKRLP